MSSDATFDLGVMRHGYEKFKRTVVVISTMEPYINMNFQNAWRGSVVKALWYLDGKPDTPLWFWR